MASSPSDIALPTHDSVTVFEMRRMKRETWSIPDSFHEHTLSRLSRQLCVAATSFRRSEAAQDAERQLQQTKLSFSRSEVKSEAAQVPLSVGSTKPCTTSVVGGTRCTSCICSAAESASSLLASSARSLRPASSAAARSAFAASS